ncbi:phosphoadenosine phosphosulfate reductase family protein [Bacillus pumilus]|uniref:phosphoadenosine phosphosulfate reductase domain-containing protein n=1 Tax=Bacillus pumilus TaxID=1408 RepID=UPI00253FE26B|nr:phosphoadenosine phosphosulfate reductase family protein [Bacillus pumilus]WIG31196.1 phosphoadenosine phosphosulfate reductase family protein [Bacillus pumilus]
MDDYRTKVTEALSLILEMYVDEADVRDWACAWSGGKDSTTVLGLLVTAIESLPVERRTRKIHVVMSDTKVENPVLESYMYDQLRKLTDYTQKNNLPIVVDSVKAPTAQSYFVLTLGRGYFLPQSNGKGRWCTDRLKLQPQNNKLAEISPSHILIGTRLAESALREKSIKKWSTSMYLGDHAYLNESKTFMPIVNWTLDDVWRYLGENSLKWSSSRAVRNLYKDATGECGINNPESVSNKAEKMESCGARFGCWLCPVILKDRSTEEMSKVHEWMEPLSEWRSMQLKIYGSYVPIRPKGQGRKERSFALRKQEAVNEEIRYLTKAGFNRVGKRLKDGQGTLTVEARKFLFNSLIETEKLVNRLREYAELPPLKLISNEEIKLIHDIWETDYKEYPHLITNALSLPIDNLPSLLDGEISEQKAAEYLAKWSERKKKSKEAI